MRAMLVAHDGTMAMNPAVFATLPYDPQRDFAPVSLLTMAPLVAMVHPATGFNSIQDVIAFARANPGKLNHATGGSAALFYGLLTYQKRQVFLRNTLAAA